jgi:hypothetical protein
VSGDGRDRDPRQRFRRHGRRLCGAVALAIGQHQLTGATDVLVTLDTVTTSPGTQCSLTVVVRFGNQQTAAKGSAQVATRNAIDDCVESAVDQLLP